MIGSLPSPRFDWPVEVPSWPRSIPQPTTRGHIPSMQGVRDRLYRRVCAPLLQVLGRKWARFPLQLGSVTPWSPGVPFPVGPRTDGVSSEATTQRRARSACVPRRSVFKL